jgi:hypothetical protein
LDLVEGSTASKTKKKKTAVRARAGDVEAPVPNDTERKKKTAFNKLTGPYQVPLGTSAHKEGVVVVVGE